MQLNNNNAEENKQALNALISSREKAVGIQEEYAIKTLLLFFKDFEMEEAAKSTLYFAEANYWM